MITKIGREFSKEEQKRLKAAAKNGTAIGKKMKDMIPSLPAWLKGREFSKEELARLNRIGQ